LFVFLRDTLIMDEETTETCRWYPYIIDVHLLVCY